MTDQTALTTTDPLAGELVTDHDAARLRQAGQEANHYAAAGAVDDYLARKAANTRRRQAADLAAFAAYLDAAGDLGARLQTFADAVAAYPDSDPDAGAWAGVTWGLVDGFTRWQLGEGYAVGTVNLRLSTVKTYAALAFKAGVIDRAELALIRDVRGFSRKETKRLDDLRAQTRRPDAKKPAPVPLTPAQARALKTAPDTPQGRRDALLMALLLDHGLRVGEVAALTVTDFDLEAGALCFDRPKVDKVQTHKLTPDALRAARAYFASDAPAVGPLLRGSRKGGQLTHAGMSEQAITARVRALGEAAGVEGLSAHDCRHYWATQAARNGTDPFSLQEAGGWASLAMPRRYVEAAKVANEGVRL